VREQTPRCRDDNKRFLVKVANSRSQIPRVARDRNAPRCAGQSISANRAQQYSGLAGDLVRSHREVANEVTARRFRKQSNPALTASKSFDDPPAGPRPRSKARTGRASSRPFDFRLHRARRCAKLICCVSIFARKHGGCCSARRKTDFDNDAAGVISRDRSIDRSIDRKFRLRISRDLRRERRKLAARIYERIPSTPRGFQSRYGVMITRICPARTGLSSPLWPVTKKSTRLFKYRSIIKVPRNSAGLRARAPTRAAPASAANNVRTSCSPSRFFIHSLCT